MDGLGLPLKGNLFPIELQLEMDCCTSTSVEGVVTTIVATTTTTIVATTTTTLGETFSTTKILVVS
jgi:hypothetical protein